MLKILTLQNPFVVMKKYSRLTLIERVKIEEFKKLLYSPLKLLKSWDEADLPSLENSQETNMLTTRITPI